MLSWLGEKTGERETVPPGGAPSFERLEARLLLNADLGTVELVPAYEATPAHHAIYVDLDGRDDGQQEDSSPTLTLDILPGDQVTQPPIEQESASPSESGPTQYRGAPEVLVSDSQVALHSNAAEPALAAQPDSVSSPPEAGPITVRGPPAEVQGQQAVELFPVAPALFVENQGQWSDPLVRYVHDGTGVDVAMTDAGVLFGFAGAEGQMLGFSASFIGANLVRPAGLEQAGTTFNYYLGDQANWRQDVPSYEVVAYEGLYEGVDLHVQGLRSHLKYEFHVAPGADYHQIAVRYEGIAGLSLTPDGSLEVNLGAGRGVIRDDTPYLYQEVDGRRVEVPGRFILLDARTYSFDVTGAIDRDHALVIDPDLLWSTYLGGDGWDIAVGIATDASGDIYVTGSTESLGWPSGGYDTTYDNGRNAFVAKLSPTGEHLWSTYIGEAREGRDIAVDASGNVYVTGYIVSAGWASGGFDTSYGGEGDAFVAKLDSEGAYVWSTYLGGSQTDAGYGIDVDISGNVYVTGQTASSGWTSGGADTTFDGQYYDGFLAKLSAAGEHLWSTYLGGNQTDAGYGVAADVSGNVYVTGFTESAGWTNGGFDTAYNGGRDAFLAKFGSTGEHLWSTYLGGSARDEGDEVAVDASGGACLSGLTYSPGWTSGGFNTTYGADGDAFVARLSPSGVPLWSSYVGGQWYDRAVDLAVDASGNLYLAGRTDSPGWASGDLDTIFLGKYTAFAVKLDSVGGLLWSTSFGGNASYANGIAVDGSGSIYVAGQTEQQSPSWTAGGFDTTPNGGWDPFVARLTVVPDTTPPNPNPATWAAEPYATGPDSIGMVATTATDPLGADYYFEELSGNPRGGHSGWQESNTYEDYGLLSNTTYIYRVKSRDRSVNHNETGYSTAIAVTTLPPDTTPPSPNPSTWATEPYETGPTSIRMVATIATDASGVQYYFEETSGNPGGTDSGWQDSNVYEDVGLWGSTTYTYRVQTRDNAGVHNTTAFSTPRSATTQPDTTPPSPNPVAWAGPPYAVSSTSIRMDALPVTDASGVEYYFEETSGNPGGTDSGWQWGRTYEDTGLMPGTTYTYRVKARDGSAGQNETDYSSALSATTWADVAPPDPNPSTWSTEPYATGPTSIRMVATTATDISGVEYYFQETSGHPGGTDSGWQDSNTYEDTGLSRSTTYTYQVKVRDKSAAQNETGYSSPCFATTLAATSPDLMWSTYLGGSSDDSANDVAVDGSGNVYVTGRTNSSGWVSGGFDTSYHNGYDVFVAKLSPSGQYLWGTYLGGSGSETGNGISVDASGNVYVTGSTDSSDWTSDGFDTTYNGSSDAFVAKLSADGQHLWSTYLGGGSADYGYDIATDASGAVYVTGFTYSSDWASSGYDPTYNGKGDAFVVKLDSGGDHLWSTYIGGGSLDDAQGIAVDTAGAVYVTGGTCSYGWTAGGFDVTGNEGFESASDLYFDGERFWYDYLGWVSVSPGGGPDAFVAKFSADGQPLWSTYLGGENWDFAYGIALDTSGAVYVTGYTESVEWTSGGAALGNVGDAFISKLNSDGPHLWTTSLGLWYGNSGQDIAVSASGAVYVTGQTTSSAWMSGGFDTTYHGGPTDAFAARLSSSGDRVWSLCLGGDNVDEGRGIAADASDHVYVTGHTEFSDWTTGGYDTMYEGGSDGFLVKLLDHPDAPPPSANPSLWATEPYATGPTSIRMVAAPASDPGGMKYYFDESSGNPGGTDSGWQDSNTYEDTDLTPGTPYTYQVKTWPASAPYNETGYSTSASAATPSPVYRFWSPTSSHHFYTISEGERDKLIRNYPAVAWTYEGIAFYAFPDGAAAGTVPVYRLWSPRDNVHLFTLDKLHRDNLIATNPPEIWTSEGIAFYVYPGTSCPAETSAVYRFWSPRTGAYFFTMSMVERDYLRTMYPSSIWTDEDEAWYAYAW